MAGLGPADLWLREAAKKLWIGLATLAKHAEVLCRGKKTSSA